MPEPRILFHRKSDSRLKIWAIKCISKAVEIAFRATLEAEKMAQSSKLAHST